MKKLLLFLFILTLAAYWGYSRGGEYGRGHNPGASPSVEEKNSFPTADNLLDKITDLAGSFTARSADSSTKEKSDFIRESKEFLQSAKESFRQIFHFKEALESKIDRDNFVPAKEIPDLMKKAIVATEDRRFYDHGAVDLVGVARALVTNYIAGKTVEGGSTIAQQTVKNIFL